MSKCRSAGAVTSSNCRAGDSVRPCVRPLSPAIRTGGSIANGLLDQVKLPLLEGTRFLKQRD